MDPLKVLIANIYILMKEVNKQPAIFYIKGLGDHILKETFELLR